MALTNAERQRRYRQRHRQQRQQRQQQSEVAPIIQKGVTELGVTLNDGEYVAFVVTVPIQQARIARDVIGKMPGLVRALSQQQSLERSNPQVHTWLDECGL
jgi:hypothetical protein